MARVDKQNGFADSLNIPFNDMVNSIELGNTSLYLTGRFTTMGGSYGQNYVGAVSTSTGMQDTWYPKISKQAGMKLYKASNAMYLGGSFYSLRAQNVKDILIPSGLTKGTGYFGAITRMFVNNQP